MSKPRLILICGVIGAGKTTLAKRMESEGGGIRLSLDEWVLASGYALNDPSARKKIDKLQRNVASMMLEAGFSVILENGFFSVNDRSIYLGLARAAQASCDLHHLEVDLDELKRRVGQRNKLVPAEEQTHFEALEACFARFEAPGEDELHLFDAFRRHRS